MLSNRDHTRLSELDMVTMSMFALSLLYQVRLFEAHPSRTREVHLLRRSSYIPTKCAFVPSFRNSSFVISRTARSTIITIAMSLFDTGGSLLCLFRSSTSVGWRYSPSVAGQCWHKCVSSLVHLYQHIFISSLIERLRISNTHQLLSRSSCRTCRQIIVALQLVMKHRLVHGVQATTSLR